MRPEDWQKGMENEAASVEDVGWARETRRYVSLAKRRAFLIDALFASLALLTLASFWVGGWVLFLRYAWQMDQNVVGRWLNVNALRFDFLLVGMLVLLGLGLGVRGLKPKSAALSLAALPLLLWLIGKVVYVEGVWNDPTIKLDKPFTADFIDYPLHFGRLRIAAACALFGFLGAWVGNVIRRKRTSSNRRQFDHPTQ